MEKTPIFGVRSGVSSRLVQQRGNIVPMVGIQKIIHFSQARPFLFKETIEMFQFRSTVMSFVFWVLFSVSSFLTFFSPDYISLYIYYLVVVLAIIIYIVTFQSLLRISTLLLQVESKNLTTIQAHLPFSLHVVVVLHLHTQKSPSML